MTSVDMWCAESGDPAEVTCFFTGLHFTPIEFVTPLD